MKRVISTFFVLVLLGLNLLAAYRGDKGEDLFAGDVEEITIWYTDAALTDFLNSSALAFRDQYNVRVNTVLYEEMSYLEAIYEASVSGNNMPDLYIAETSNLEEAIKMGIAHPVLHSDTGVLKEENFPGVALSAVTYHNTYFGYPFYYDTAYLLYNATYLAQMAAENGLSGVDLVPATIEDIEKFADLYTPPETVENFFVWDASDIFYNYFFAGNYFDVGGVNGDDPTICNIYNEDAVACLQVYQELNQYFSFETKEQTMQKVLDNFIAGKVVYTITTAEALKRIEAATLNEEFEYSYGIAMLPGIDSEHPAKGLSVTDGVIINGYSEHKEAADAFAAFMVTEMSSTLYSRTGKLPCVNASAENLMEVPPLVRSSYISSVSLPKLVELETYWMQLELAYNKIWNGDDPDEILRNLATVVSDNLMIHGEEIVDDVKTEETVSENAVDIETTE